MNFIKPTSNLQSNFAEILKAEREVAPPGFSEENDCETVAVGDYENTAISDIKDFDDIRFENEIYSKLQEAVQEAAGTNKKFTYDDVLQAAKRAAESQ
ncbi:MAG: hypothetical protein LBO03_03285 [Acidaminococcales bacterium]|jgi:hypothetical protein|nr:hypothetical protein [Acidaminococcales bacterium]